MIELPKVKIRGTKKRMIFIQGGMGIEVAGPPLVSEVSRLGGIGTASSAGLAHLHYEKYGKKVGIREATRHEITLAKAKGGFVAINCMVPVVGYRESVFGALDAGVNAIISGAGVPKLLPGIVNEYKAAHPDYDCSVALIPIVSKLRALEVICEYWRRKYKRCPDAVIVEGPKAGGHLGFDFSDVEKEEYQLENLFPAIKEFARTHGDFPVIVAGGIFSNRNIVSWAKRGADGVQVASRFAVTHESYASPGFKKSVLNSKKGDIVISEGSPCGMIFRVIKSSPGLTDYQVKCTKGFVLQQRDGSPFCLAKDKSGFFCICSVLLAAIGSKTDFQPVYTIGAEGYKIREILSVEEIMRRLGVRK